MRQGGGMRGLAAAAMLTMLALFLAATPGAMHVAPARATAEGIDAATLYVRIQIIGASASAGFGVRAPLPAEHPARLQAVTLSSIAQDALAGPGKVTGDATGLFFLSPIGSGRQQVDGVLAASPRPTIVLGVDFLFWFTYGAADAQRNPIKDEAQRLAMLETGLAEADRIVKAGIPLVIGDIPDMSASVGKMISKAQMPALSTIDAANERIRAWAAERARVAVVPLARLVEQLRAGKPFDAGRRTWSEEADGPLLQRDQLHPTFTGSVALLARIEQAANDRFLGATQPNAPGAPRIFEHDPQRVADALRQRLSQVPAAAPGSPGTPGTPAPRRR